VVVLVLEDTVVEVVQVVLENLMQMVDGLVAQEQLVLEFQFQLKVIQLQSAVAAAAEVEMVLLHLD
jgi:hypothetical protein